MVTINTLKFFWWDLVESQKGIFRISKNVFFGHYMNKLQIFKEVLKIGFRVDSHE